MALQNAIQMLRGISQLFIPRVQPWDTKQQQFSSIPFERFLFAIGQTNHYKKCRAGYSTAFLIIVIVVLGYTLPACFLLRIFNHLLVGSDNKFNTAVLTTTFLGGICCNRIAFAFARSR